MNVFMFIAAGMIMCVMIITVGQMKPELSLLLTVACGIVLMMFLLGAVNPVISEITSLATAGGVDSEMLAIVLKSFGICVAVQTAADVCRDAGQSALAGKLELGGRLALLIIAIPLFRQLWELSTEIIGK